MFVGIRTAILVIVAATVAQPCRGRGTSGIRSRRQAAAVALRGIRSAKPPRAQDAGGVLSHTIACDELRAVSELDGPLDSAGELAAARSRVMRRVCRD
jgi:hypothetical protein